MTRGPLPVQVDGDHIGQTPMTFEAVPGALRALMPPMLSSDLLRTEIRPPRYVWQRMLGWFGSRRGRTRAPADGRPADNGKVKRG